MSMMKKIIEISVKAEIRKRSKKLSIPFAPKKA
jgi:hypothetical protein